MLLAILVVIAILLREKSSLIALIDRKFDLLIQLAPAFFIGLHWSGLRAGPTLAGIICGTGIALLLAFGDLRFVANGKLLGFHPGLVGLVPNLLIAVVGSLMPSRALRTRNAL